jgi:hypothetical protein
MTNSPFLFIQWLSPSETNREAGVVRREFLSEVGIEFVEATDKNHFESSLADWLLQNPSNSQYVYIGSHGIRDSADQYIGIGPTGQEYVSWDELSEILVGADLCPVVWLGTCGSSFAAQAWSPFVRGKRPARWIVGFRDAALPAQIESALRQLMGRTDIGRIEFADEEAELLEKMFERERIEFFFPACDLRGGRYLGYRNFEDEVGMTLKEYLERHPGACD